MVEPTSATLALFEALAHPVRAQILTLLRQPRILREILVHQPDKNGHSRPLARQTVRVHLDHLLDAGLVAARDTVSTRGRTLEYVVDHRTLFALAETVREWASRRPVTEVDAETVAVGMKPVPLGVGPGLLLVKGLDEGRMFSLEARRPIDGRWTIGRAETADVRLDYDPFVSHQHATLDRDGARFVLRDHPESKNGTTFNFSPLGAGEERIIDNGDVIGVGRSYLLFRSGATRGNAIR